MVRERTTCREFKDRFILHPGSESLITDIASFLATFTPLEVDLGCGRGRFLLARARQHPHHAFIGVERVSLRIRKVDTRACRENLSNIRLIQADALTVMRSLIPPGSVSVAYLFFPDPWPKRRHHTRRLVAQEFIDAIHRSLSPGGVIHIATDHADYFKSISQIWNKDPRFRETPPYIPSEEEETDFGMLFRAKGLHTNRCSFQKHPQPFVALAEKAAAGM